jgi:serine/threonine-protein kinase
MGQGNTHPSHRASLGRYQIAGRLAVGGMAEIFLAKLFGPSGFERPLVIKRILPHLAEIASFREMFVDEARLVAELRHPNVVQVLELGLDGSELFLAMEYVEGESLGSLMRRMFSHDERPDWVVAAHILAEVCAGLHAAHELRGPDGAPREVVHRDVSPQNVVIAYDGAVKLLDFGIAKAAGRATHTEAGQVKGKFEYMSPEQCRSEPLDRRSDVFSAGILLYELTTRTRLFKRDSQMATMLAVCDDPMPSPRALVPGYPERLEAICRRALEKDPAARYPDAAAMRFDLLRASADLGLHAAPEVDLGRLMRRLFADRVEEKRNMLLLARSGESAVDIPAAEADAHVELPTVAATALTFDPGRAAPPAGVGRRRRSAPLAVAAAALALAAAGVLYVASAGTRGATLAPPASATVAAPGGASVEAPAATADPATAAPSALAAASASASPVSGAAEPSAAPVAPKPHRAGPRVAEAPAASSPAARATPEPAAPPSPASAPPAASSAKRGFERFQ